MVTAQGELRFLGGIMDKLWKIADAMKRAAERDSHAGLYAEREDLASEISRYESWEDEGQRYGEPKPERPTLKSVNDALKFHGYKWNARSGEVVKA
ncbi:hypothetical protein PBI_MIMI_31 [Arthrobacter phage Mimi]|nr:hypothetical protein PBI_MIMI_110 [Arthrobacter phage Mimi]